eukprot:COSAG03_NODE_243_length_10072_cov_11.712925_10_plen_41_part_00
MWIGMESARRAREGPQQASASQRRTDPSLPPSSELLASRQ